MKKKILDILEEYANNFTKKEFSNSSKELEQFSFLLNRPESPRIEEVPLMNPLSVLILLGTLEEKGVKITREAQSEMQSRIAKLPRPANQKPERKEVYKYWQDWQQKRTLYSTKSDFIRDMLEKTGINRPETIRKWIKDFEAVNRLSEDS